MNSIKILRISTVSHSLSILLKNQFRYIGQLGYDYTLMCYPDNLVLEQTDKERTSFHPLYLSRKLNPFSDLIQLIRLVFFILRSKPQIVHTHSPKAGLIGMLAAKITGVRGRVHTVAGLPLVEKTGLYKYLLILLERLCYSCANIVIFNSPNQAEYVAKNGWIDPTKIRVIGNGSSNGIDTDYFNHSTDLDSQIQLINNEIEKKDDDIVMVFVGRIAKSKGIEELVSAFLLLLDKDLRLRLILVGSNDDTDPVSKIIWEEINSNSRISWFDYQEDVRPYFQMSDIFVFPSYREGFPQVIMQACSMGCAIVATDINGANEIIDNNDSGILIEPKSAREIFNACETLINNKGLRDEFGFKSRKKIMKGFEQKSFWDQLDSLYRKVLE